MTIEWFIIVYLLVGIFYGLLEMFRVYRYLEDITAHREVPDHVLNFFMAFSETKLTVVQLLVITYVVTLFFFPVVLFMKLVRTIVG